MEAITVALIGLVGSILVVLIEKGRKENARDHGIVAEHLQKVEINLNHLDEDLAHIESKLDNHIHDHLVGGFDLDDLRFKTGEFVKTKNIKVKKNGSKKS
jgi:hypothetical protein